MKALAFVLVLFLAVNVGVLYYIVLFGDVPEFAQRLDLLERRVDSLVQRETQNSDQLQSVVKTDGGLVILSDQQKQELAELVRDKVAADVDELVADAQAKITEDAAAATAKTQEYFIPIGNASVKTSDYAWRDVPVEVEFDRANYGGTVTRVSVEATMRVPTGNGQVQMRLYDTSTGVVPGSELTGESAGGVFVKSGALSIAAGRRTLRLQMRTSLDYEGIVENARLRVLVD